MANAIVAAGYGSRPVPPPADGAPDSAYTGLLEVCRNVCGERSRPRYWMSGDAPTATVRCPFRGRDAPASVKAGVVAAGWHAVGVTEGLPIHVDDVRSHRWEYGEIGAARRRLGIACAAKRLGIALIEIDPGKRSTPLHSHADEDEVFLVLAGRGLSVQTSGPDAVRTYTIGVDDLLWHPANGDAHTLIAGDQGSPCSWLPRDRERTSPTCHGPSSSGLARRGRRPIARTLSTPMLRSARWSCPSRLTATADDSQPRRAPAPGRT